jgi:hypothetical protein
MSKKVSKLALLAMLLLATGVARAAGPGELKVGIDIFYDQLAPYGEWITLDPYGWVWCPYDIEPGWRPYWDGEWAYTDCGWDFMSPVEWGWAAYHYGRWGFHKDHGWYWVPDNVWGPSWVAWRHGDRVMGWAPLPPGVGWSVGIGLDWGGIDPEFGIGWDQWSFCDIGWFGDRDMRRHIFDRGRNVSLLRGTRNVTNYSFAGNRVINNNIEVTQLERESGRRFERYSIVDAQGNEQSYMSKLSGSELRVFRPNVTPGRSGRAPVNVLPARRFSGSPDEFNARQQKEKADFENHYQAEHNTMVERHRLEAGAVGSSAEEMKNRHEAEVRALEEQRRKERLVLENRHQREQERYKSQHQTGSPRKK